MLRTRVVRKGSVVARRSLLSRGERVFYQVLRSVLKADHAISLKTRLVDIVGCPDHLWKAPLGRRLAQKHVDFVLYDIRGGEILAAVELDDRSHDTPERQKRDRFLNRVLHTAKIPLIRVRAASRYDPPELRKRLDAALGSLPLVRHAETSRP